MRIMKTRFQEITDRLKRGHKPLTDKEINEAMERVNIEMEKAHKEFIIKQNNTWKNL